MKKISKIFRKESPDTYVDKDSQLIPTLRLIDILALGVGMVLGTAIFTLPGIVAAKHTGPAVALSFVVGAIGAGLAGMAYAETSSALPFAGSAYSWISILFGEVAGWLVGWALLAEYLVSVSFVASGWSSYFRGFIESLGIQIPKVYAGGFNLKLGTIIDIFSVMSILLVAFLLSKGLKKVSKFENSIVLLKLIVILLFILVGFREIQINNLLPFIPKHIKGTDFGGIEGIWTGASQIFLAYVGFDAISANAAETKNAEKNVPRGIMGTLLIGTIFFVFVSTVLVGMFKYNFYADNAEPVSWALRKTGHYITADLVSLTAIFGMFAGLIGMMLAGSRLLYSFGRDGLLPKKIGKLNNNGLPNNALLVLTILAGILGGLLPFTFLANLVSSGTLIAFITVSLAIYKLRPREGVDIPMPKFKMPLYPILPIISALFSCTIFWGLNTETKILTLIWFGIGLILYILDDCRMQSSKMWITF